MESRRFEFVDGSSNKFWEITRDGTRFTVRFGRIGSAGQSQTKAFTTDDEARLEAERLVNEKLKKGYIERASGSACVAAEPQLSASDSSRDDGVSASGLEPTLSGTPTANITRPVPPKKMERWFAAYRRLMFIPDVQDGDLGLTASKFGGTAWLAEGESWPHCGGCRRPMQLFLQLNLDQLPAELGRRFGEGLLQYFMCTWTDVEKECGAMTQAYFPLSENKLVRVVRHDYLPRSVSAPDVGTNFPCKTMVGWKKSEEYPRFIEWERLGLREEDDFDRDADLVRFLRCDRPKVNMQTSDQMYEFLTGPAWCSQGDKLAGWPWWTQEVEYPDCPKCGCSMTNVVFQLDSRTNLPYSFGRSGIGNVFQCPKHLDSVVFIWYC
jgi:predicted DNA-binding WGR domain protein/uncharacterized protein YwqG